MYVKNLDPPSQREHLKYKALAEFDNYPLHYAFKFVAWSLVIASIAVSSAILIIYGITFGMIKSYLWLTGFLASFLVSLIVVAPVRILVFAAIKTILMKSKPAIIRRKIPNSLLTNPENEEKKNQILKFRSHSANLYKPTSLCKLQNRATDIKHNLELRNLAVNVVLYFSFLLTAAFVVLFNTTEMSYYTNDAIAELFLKGAYTDSVSFMNVDTQKMFLKYLNETLLPALFPVEGLNETNDVFERGWTSNPQLKLLGKPRLRQIRVRTDSCRELPEFEGRNIECAPELTLFNVERRDFSLYWASPPPQGLIQPQINPWLYQSGLKSVTVPIFAEFSSYLPGGYVLELARNLDDARRVLKFMDTFQWIDTRTRVVFVEFTLYCVNTNLFSVVTIIAEAPANGYIIPSYQIDTCKFLILKNEIEISGWCFLVVFCVTLCILIFKESIKVHKTSFKFYYSSSSAMLDLTIIIFGLISLLFEFLKSVYVATLLDELEKADNNVFVSFYYAVVWNSWSDYFDAILICTAPFKLFQLLTFKVHFFQIHYILNQCYKFFVSLCIQEMILIIGFALFFHMTLINHSQIFSTFGNSLSTMIGRSAALDDEFDFTVFLNNSSFLIPMVFILFAFVIPICFLNIFIAVVCLYFNKIRNTTFLDKYKLSDYIKHFLTLKNQKDILHMKNVDYLIVNNPKRKKSEVMRLKGGGNAFARKRYCKIKKKKPKMIKVVLKDFMTRKQCDLIKYVDLRKDRNLALKKMMLMLISEDEKVPKENSLLTLYYSYITEKKKLYLRAGEYFFAEGEGTSEILDRNLFSRMKRVVEDLGREKGIIEDEEICDEVDSMEEKLSLLEKKCTCLVKKLQKK